MRNQFFLSKYNLIIATTLLLTLCLSEYAYGQLSTANGYIYLRDQHLFGNNAAGLVWKSNHSTAAWIHFRDKENTQYGSIHGGGNGAFFGLTDGDGNWSYLAAKDNYTAFRINNNEKMRLLSNGNVGIGTSAPKAPVQIGQQLTINSPHTNGGWGLIGVNWYWANGADRRILNAPSSSVSFPNNGDIYFRSSTQTGAADSPITSIRHNLEIYNDGGVRIWAPNSGDALEVCGTGRFTEVIVEDNWCDYVFEADYCLTSLEEEAEFIERYGHLSNFESAKDMDGLININDIFKRQQIQIEENVLHLIKLNEVNETLQIQVDDLTENIDQLNAQVTTLSTNYKAVIKELAIIKKQLR